MTNLARIRDKVLIHSMMDRKGIVVMTPELKALVNDIIQEHGSIMLEHRCERLYWLPRHWCYINFQQHCPRIKVGVTNYPDTFEYLTEPFN